MNGKSEPIIRIERLVKTFKTTVALNDISLDVWPGEFLTLLGPSGCGKTTLLRLLGGFEAPSSGRIFIDGRNMNTIHPHRRPIHTVFQSYAVFPHMSVTKNIAYGLEVEGQPKHKIEERVREMLSLVQLEGHAHSMPDSLSGGQKQRVALARALVKRPQVILLDEPLSALDAKLREAMRLELVRLRRLVGITFIMVTHDQEEALSMSSRIVVMQNGKILQVSSPAQLYEFPSSLAVAQLVGQINVISKQDLRRVGIDPPPGGGAVLAIRPEKVFTSETRPDVPDVLAVNGRVEDIMYCGKFTKVFFNAGLSSPLIVDVANVLRDIDYYTFKPGERLWCYWRLSDCLHFDQVGNVVLDRPPPPEEPDEGTPSCV